MAGNLSPPTWTHLLAAERLVSGDLPGLPHLCSGLAARVQVPHLSLCSADWGLGSPRASLPHRGRRLCCRASAVLGWTAPYSVLALSKADPGSTDGP